MKPETYVLLGTLGGTLLGSLIGFFGTWLSMRYQHRIKSIELASQARLRAKELLFTTYQDRITRISQRATDLQSAFGSFLGMYKAIEDENERRQLNEGMLELLKQVYEFRREYFEELKEERRKVGLENTNPVQMSAIEDSLKLDISTIHSQTEALEMVVGIVRMIAASDNLWQDVLAKKGEDLFSEEINYPGYE